MTGVDTGSIVITYRLPEPSYARIEVYDSLGQRVRTLVDAWHETGLHSVTWDGLDDSGHGNAAGIYLYRLSSGGVAETGKMILNDGADGVSRQSAAFAGTLERRPGPPELRDDGRILTAYYQQPAATDDKCALLCSLWTLPSA